MGHSVYTHSQFLEEMRINTRKNYLKFLIIGALGLQNILRTTEYIITYGGGLFTYPFIVSCFFISLPIYYSEVFLSQYTRKSVLSLWEMAPITYGFFFYIFAVGGVAGVFKAMHTSYSWYYFFHTFSPNMTKSRCDPEDEGCLDPSMYDKLDPACVLNVMHVYCPNATLQFPLMTYVWNLLKPEAHRDINSRLIGCTFFTWIFMYIMMFLNIYKLKKLFAGIILFALIDIGLLLIIIYLHGGSEEALKYIFSVRESEASLYEILFWAIYHSFEVTSLTNPVHYSFPSRITFISNPAVESLYVTLFTVSTALLFSYFNFAVIAIISRNSGLQIDRLRVPAAEAIIVTVIPYFLSNLPSPKLWLIAYNFFLVSILTLNLATWMTAFVQCILSYYKAWHFQKYILPVCALLGCFLSLPLVTEYGFVIIQPLYQIRFLPVVKLIAVFLETFTFYWLYGTSVLFVDIQFMKKSPPKVLWKVWWNIAPIVVAGLMYFHFTNSLTYLDQHLSDYQMKVSNIMMAFIIMIIPIGTLVKVVQFIKKEKMDSLLKPEFTWGPPNPHLRALRKKYNPSEEIRSQPFTYHQWRLELYTEEKILHENTEDAQT